MKYCRDNRGRGSGFGVNDDVGCRGKSDFGRCHISASLEKQQQLRD